MREWFESMRAFFRENPRLWVLLALAVVIGGSVLWAVFGGLSLEIGRFFAAPEDYCTSDGDCASDETCVNNQCQTESPTCGPVPTAQQTCGDGDCDDDGAKNPVVYNGNDCDDANSCIVGQSGCRQKWCGDGTCQATDENSSSCPGDCPGGGGGSPTPTGGVPTDPTGACEFRTQFNAPEGAWFCKDLQCQLDGNPSGGQEYPPKGPASNLAINVYNRSTQAPNPALGPIFVRYILDSTPKCSGGGECYPPKDPLWSCTRPDGKEVDLGRNGHDFYDCYKPIIRVYDAVPVTCCANTGLNGDCYTIRETVPGGDALPSAAPSSSATPSTTVSPTATTSPTATASPTGSSAPTEAVECAPASQTVLVNQTAQLEANGGNNSYDWSLAGGQHVSGGNEYIGVKYSTTGTKNIRVTSAGTSDLCTVTVVASSTPAPTPTPTSGGQPPQGTVQPSTGLSIRKSARNTTVGEPAGNNAISVYPGQTAQFTVDVLNSGSTVFSRVHLQDMLPPGMTFKHGSTIIEGRPIVADVVTVMGLELGRLAPGEEITVQWSAVADRTASLPAGPNQSNPMARVSVDGIPDSTADVTVTVYGAGSTFKAGDVPTGPGGALILALLTASLLTLLYSGYTRSEAFHRKEADIISREHDPLDFRS